MVERPAFAIFEGYAVSSILASFQMSGLLELLEGNGIGEATIADRSADEAALLRASLRYLAQRLVVTGESDTYQLTEYGRELSLDKGYLVWLVGGYGEPLRRMDAFLGAGKRYGVDYVRDGKWVAGGAALLGGKDVVPQAMELLGRLSFDQVLDLGCGNAKLLTAICRKFGARGVGVDISPEACADAEEVIAANGLIERVHVVQADAGALGEIEALARTDLVVTFFLLHEILANGRDRLVGYLTELADTLPAGAHLLIAEVEPAVDGRTGGQRFTPEFTFVHALMRQILLPANDWVEVLTTSGFTVDSVQRNEMPGGILLLATKAA
jgi:SAM-dependent methyltransferase